MILKPRREDIKIIGFYLSKIINYLGLCMLIPLVFSLWQREINPCLDFALGALVCFIIGNLGILLCWTEEDLGWVHGMVVVALAWLVAMVFGAIPLYLSGIGHWASFLDTCFEAMSGFATTGLVLVQDLDHLSFTHNLWRHFIMFLGGQGIVLVMISFLFRVKSGAFKMYVSEARDERILPNVVETARFIWRVSATYLLLGTLGMGAILLKEGLVGWKAFYHAACIFMAAFDTGGFGVYSQNILYYHSPILEIANLTCMLLGTINFSMHYSLWTGKRKDFLKDIEIRYLLFSLFSLSILVCGLLGWRSLYPSSLMLFRKGFYHLISAHSGAGHSTLYSLQFKDWPQLALFGLILAMAVGGCVGSTTGAIKSLRIGIFLKGIKFDIKRLMLPEDSRVMDKFYHLKEILLEERLVKSACMIILLYLGLYLLGAVFGTLLGYPFLEALFESTSAAANVGLSCGITQPAMPSILKIVYIFQMWVGRLEFLSIFVLMGFVVAWVKGK